MVLALLRCFEENRCYDGAGGEVDLDKRCCYFVLQENDPGEMICWDSFTTPELKNFLRILDREEAWYKKRIHEKYDLVLQTMQRLKEEKQNEMLLL